MIRASLGDCLQALGAELHGVEDADQLSFHGVSIDTRNLNPGELYVAIAGDRFDGHDFVAEAERQGAVALLVSREVSSELPQIRVGNTRKALADLARYWRRQHHMPVIGITGSNGKTTVKELLASILSQCGQVLSTRGNLNNELGAPLTLLRLGSEHDFAVVEMGANHVGEIAFLADIARPDVGVVTSIGGVHLEGFGSIDGVVTGKSELFEALAPGGCAVINAEDAYRDRLTEAASQCRKIRFAFDGEADVVGGTGSGLRIRHDNQEIEAAFALPGRHNRLNALAAAAVAIALDVPLKRIKAGLEAVKPVPGRLVTRVGAQGATIIDDSYNANPVSARAAIDVLVEQGGQTHFALGDMGELGDEAESLHETVGAHAAASGVDGFWALGPLAGRARQRFVEQAHGLVSGGAFDSHDALVEMLRPVLSSDCTVLVKGSRSARMENVVNALLDGAGA